MPLVLCRQLGRLLPLVLRSRLTLVLQLPQNELKLQLTPYPVLQQALVLQKSKVPAHAELQLPPVSAPELQPPHPNNTTPLSP